ncbi:hypothetical protein [Arthrobacter sulfonylureivorans]|uniref:Uncharacterized protein n=1 Tax=Arthrobacter sulfonylureivorans TaxID=2486855 RepID=A0ABY3WEE4_9MICC|nr:hypothetical protein [Arthrobacter sulfonylureivorans]UNK46756.1 hypothetical protein MNQ99_05220 [Arthrobacter sulfonylureivorans]
MEWLIVWIIIGLIAAVVGAVFWGRRYFRHELDRVRRVRRANGGKQ